MIFDTHIIHQKRSKIKKFFKKIKKIMMTNVELYVIIETEGVMSFEQKIIQKNTYMHHIVLYVDTFYNTDNGSCRKRKNH